MRVTARVEGADRLASRFRLAAAELPTILQRELYLLARSHTRIMRSVAPHETGRLASRIQPEPRASGYQIISPVRSPEGFPYTGSTRFGRGPVVPRNAQALRFTIGGRVIFASRVGPYRPAGDWADEGYPAAVAAAERSASRIGAQVVAI